MPILNVYDVRENGLHCPLLTPNNGPVGVTPNILVISGAGRERIEKQDALRVLEDLSAAVSIPKVIQER